FIHEGKRYRGCTFESMKSRAIQVEALIRRRLMTGEEAPPDDVTFKELMEEYLELLVKTKIAQEFYSNILTVMHRHFGQTPISEIGVKEAEAFMVAIKTRDKKPASPG